MAGIGFWSVAATAILCLAGDSQPEFTLRTSSGPVSFDSIRVGSALARGGGGDRVSGIATNRGQRKWKSLLLEVELVDETGQTVGKAALTLRDFDRGQSKPFSEPVQFTNPEQRKFTGSRIVYKSGINDVKYLLQLVSPARSQILSYADQDMAFAFAVSDAAIEVTIKNQSRLPVRVVWENAVFTDVFEGTHLVDRAGNGDATIRAAGTLKESVRPVNDGKPVEAEGWRADRILPRTQDAGEMNGRSVSLTLPVEVEGTVRTYRFVFQILETLF